MTKRKEEKRLSSSHLPHTNIVRGKEKKKNHEFSEEEEKKRGKRRSSFPYAEKKGNLPEGKKEQRTESARTTRSLGGLGGRGEERKRPLARRGQGEKKKKGRKTNILVFHLELHPAT